MFFTYQNIILGIAALANIVMTAIVWSRGMKNKVNLTFGLLTLFNFMWCTSIFFFNVLASPTLLMIANRGTYIMGVLIIVTLFYFVLYFPYISSVSEAVKYIILIGGLIIMGLSLTKYLVAGNLLLEEGLRRSEILEPVGASIYTLYLLSVGVYILYLLHKKINISELIYRNTLRALFWSILLALAAAVTFDLIISFFGESRFNIIGPCFTMLLNLVVIKLVFSTKDKMIS